MIFSAFILGCFIVMARTDDSARFWLMMFLIVMALLVRVAG